MKKLRKSKYNLIISVIPFVLIAGGLKIAFHYLEWEFIPKELSSFFPSILTGIIFILGFLLAGVVGDYKECEKIPNEIGASLYALWQEAEFLKTVIKSKAACSLMEKLKKIVPSLKNDFFISRNGNLEILIDSMSEDIIEMGREGATANYLIRMKTEVANLRKTVTRINVIKKTDFNPAVFTSLQIITGIFIIVYGFLNIEPWWGGLIIICIFSLVIFSLLFLIRDMEDPFEYDADWEPKSGEISLAVLDDFQKEIESRESSHTS